MSLSSVLKMPKRHLFWLVEQIGRLEAHEDLRTLNILLVAGAQNAEVISKAVDQLHREVGEIYVYEPTKFVPQEVTMNEEDLDPEFDRASLQALKFKHGA